MANLDVALILRLVDQFSQPLRKAREGLGRLKKDVGGFGRGVAEGARGALAGADFDEAARKSQASFGRAKSRMMGAVGGAVALGLPVREAAAFETAMANVAKVVDLDARAFARMSRDVLALTRTLPMAGTEIAAIVAAGGQAGLATRELLPYTEMAAKIGVAFDVSADQAGKAMANLKNSLNLSLGETGLLADAMNFLSNKMATSAQQVLDVTLRVGAQGKQFGLGAKEVAAFGGAMVAAGAQSEIASTSLRNLGLKLTKGEAATTAQRKALADLGLEAVNVAKAMQVDAAGTILDAFERIGALPDFRRTSVSSMLLGDETRALGPLITNIGLLRQALALVQNENEYAGSALREYERQAETSANQLQISRNGLTETAIIIGTVLLPALNEASARFNTLTGAFSAFAEKNPDLSSGLVKTAAGLVALSVAGRVAGFLFSGLRVLAVPALAAIAAAGWPVVTVGAAIAAAGLLLLQYWKPVKAFFSGLAEGLGLNRLPDLLAPLGEAIAGAFLPMGRAIGGVIDWFGKLTRPLAATKAEFESTRALGVQLGQALVKTFTRPLDALGDLLASIGSLGNEIVKAFTGIDLAAEGGRILTTLWDGMKAVWAEFKAWLGRIGPAILGAFSFEMPSFLSRLWKGGDASKGTPAAARGSGVGGQAPVITYDNNPRIAVSAKVTVNTQSNATVARDAGRAVEQRVRRALDDAAVAMP